MRANVNSDPSEKSIHEIPGDIALKLPQRRSAFVYVIVYVYAKIHCNKTSIHLYLLSDD
jgi:hypothetical protein